MQPPRARLRAAQQGQTPHSPRQRGDAERFPRVPPPRFADASRPAEPEHDPLSLTNELEPVSEDVQRRRDLDNSIARFSAVHDEVVEEERRKRSKRSRYLPWVSEVDELDDALTFTPTTTATPVDPAREEPATKDPATEEPATGEPAEPGAEPGAHPGARPGARPNPRLTRLRAKKQRRTERSVFASKVLAVVVSALVLLGCGVGWGAKEWADGKPTRVAALEDGSAAMAAGQKGDRNFPLSARTHARASTPGHAPATPTRYTVHVRTR